VAGARARGSGGGMNVERHGSGGSRVMLSVAGTDQSGSVANFQPGCAKTLLC